MIQNAIAAFHAALGVGGCTTDEDLIAPWLTDWRGRYRGRAAALLSPTSSAQVAEILMIAAEHRVALVPQGGNSGMVAGATPGESGGEVILSLRRMNRIIDYDVQSGLVTAEAGVILQNLHDAVAEKGRRFPLTLGGKGSATVGGLVSTNAGGTQVLRHGTMRKLVVGLEAVLPDGSIYDGLAALKKDNRGYDLTQLLIGAEGTLGIVTKAKLATVPALLDRCVVWAGVDSPSAAYELFRFAQQRAAYAVEGFEILPQVALDDVLKHIPGTRPPLSSAHGWHILIELVQDDAAQIAPAELAEQLLTAAMEQGLVEDAVLATSEAQAEAFWKIRDSIAEAERAEGLAMQHDISVPVEDMARFIESESSPVMQKFAGTKIVAFGHLGDGNIHFHVKAPPQMSASDWNGGLVEEISGHIYDRVTAYQGSISAEHGIGKAKLAQFSRLTDPARLHALRAIKAAFDPLGLLNPGKLVPPPLA